MPPITRPATVLVPSVSPEVVMTTPDDAVIIDIEYVAMLYGIAGNVEP